MRRLTIATAVLMLLIGAGLANAGVITASFGDSAYYWATWASPGNAYNINNTEHIGVPDIFGGAAVVRVDASEWVDYLQLGRWNGQWKIVNVLWEMRPSS